MTFSHQGFIAELNNDRRRIGRSYLYEVVFNFNKLTPTTMKSIPPLTLDLERKLTFFCSDAMIPGWRASTERGKIYGLPYEVVTGLEQDPLWLSFNSDIMHKIPNIFLSGIKDTPQRFSTFGAGANTPYAPRYKSEYQFGIDLYILDDQFNRIATYNFINSFIKTVQMIQLGADNKGIPKVTVEIVYERVSSELARQPNQPSSRDTTSTIGREPDNNNGFSLNRPNN